MTEKSIPQEKIKDFVEKSGQGSTPGRARSKKQFDEMKKAENTGKCIFCRDPQSFKNKPLTERKFWYVKRNDFPYFLHRLHLVAVLKQHIDRLDADDSVWGELGPLLSDTKEVFNLPAINFVMRFGDPALRSSTIHHLHGHIQIPSWSIAMWTKKQREKDKTLPIDCPFCLPNGSGFKEVIAKSEKGLWSAIHNPNPFPNQRTEILIFFNHCSSNSKDVYEGGAWVDLFGLIKKINHREGIAGGGLVFQEGNVNYTNGISAHPYLTIHAPNGTGRVHAAFSPDSEKIGKPFCKATFCKGFEGEELKKLQEKMKAFQGK